MTLALYVLLLLLFLSQLVLRSAHESKIRDCSPFLCGRLEEIGFPFSNTINPECGLCVINCTGPEPKVQFHKHGKWYPVVGMDYEKRIITIHDPEVQTQLDSNRCDLLNSFTEPVSPFLSISVIKTLPFIKCKRVSHPTPLAKLFHLHDNYTRCKGYDIFYDAQNRTLLSLPEPLLNHCSVVMLPATNFQGFGSGLVLTNLTLLWDANFTIRWHTSRPCLMCHRKGGRCQNSRNNSFECCRKKDTDHKGMHPNLKQPRDSTKSSVITEVGIGVATGVVSILLTCITFIIYQCNKRKTHSSSSALISGDIYSDPYLNTEHELGSVYFQTQIFTYKELEEATNQFESNKKLGDGGFRTVYHGKLHDGRVVAVKHLFEHNYKRVRRFMNEIVILSRLCHPHLVSLYGCTKLDSSELLLVYEYVANGTVADHLHGNRANDGLLTWPIRMSIAIETADALAYLHTSDIIHRDVKTNNILLDSSFHVKVADFGLSRLLPTNATHVLTAPQGTPGYIDPDYYQCYQLNNKSDVYSLGVVLIELISSKPAVDIGRQRHEINLASMALNKIHNQALHELVNPNIGFDSDYSTRNMITLVAELAFRCLQQEKEMRPCMMEVFETLRRIQNEEYKM